MKITVFTPTHNRAYILENLFKSLKRQNFYDFEWIIIDDGSIDGTIDLVSSWTNEKLNFQIKFERQENSGKHIAINKGLKLATAKLFFIVDSDDYITDDALFKINHWYENLTPKDSFWAISGNVGFSKNKLIGETFQSEYLDSYYIDRIPNNIIGDKAEVFFTDVIRDYHFPKFEEEKFLFESALFLEFGQKYKIRYFNDIIYIADYLEDGLSNNIREKILQSPKGYAYVKSKELDVFKRNYKDRLSFYYYYWKDFYKNRGAKYVIKNLGISYFTMFISLAIFGTLNQLRKLNNE